MSPGPDEGTSVQSRSKRKGRKGKERADTDNHATAEPHSVGETVNAAQQLIPPWAWTILADSDTSGCPPVFSRDAKYFFVASSSSVRIYSVATTRVVSTLRIQYNEHSGSTTPRITGLLISPQNPFQLITASSDGRIRIWDVLDAVLLRTIECRLHISHIVAHSSLKDYVIVAGTKQKGGRFRLYRVSISPSPPDSEMKKAYENAKFGSDPLSGLVISSSGSHIVAILGNNVYVLQTAQLSSPLAEYSSPNPLTCLAFHPVDEIFATGDTQGIIRIWYCLDPRKNIPKNALDKRRSKVPTRVLHWHAHAVGGLVFSSNGAYLLSGGEEAVFVVWQLESRHKEFVPRLGAPIEHVTITPEGSSGQGYLLSLADGGMSFIDAGSLKVTRTFVQLRRTSWTHETANESTDPAPLAIHSTTSHVILPSSHPSSLQIYAPRSSELIYELEVSPSNRVSRRDETPLEQARVTHAVICASGEWMSTVDIRHGGVDFADEVMLKIWHWEDANWVLNTRIDRPHGVDPVTSLTFSPRPLDDAEDYVLLTAGANGMLRTWRPWKTHDGDGTRLEVIREDCYRDQYPSQAVWSPDASLIAVAHGPSTTIWEPISNTLIMSLSCAGADSFYDLAFLGSSGRHLATYTGKDIIVWDLIANSIAWTHRIHLRKHILVPHPADNTFALIGESPPGGRVNPSTHPSSKTDTLVTIFGVSSSRPLHSYSLPFKLRHAIWYPTSDPASENGTHSPYSLLAVTVEQRAVLIGDDVVVHSLETPAARGITSVEETFERTTIFQDLFGRSAFANLEERGQSSKVDVQRSLPDISTDTKVLDLTILDGPSHLLPPIGSLFDSLIESFTRAEDRGTHSESLRDKDVEMHEVDEADGRQNVTLTRRRAPRQIDEEEMSLFTGLFRTVLSASSERSTISSSKQANGSTNGNGTVTGHHSNGKIPPMSAYPTSPTKEKSSRTRKPAANNALSPSTPRVKPTEPVIPSPSPSIGQKRKKPGI